MTASCERQASTKQKWLNSSQRGETDITWEDPNINQSHFQTNSDSSNTNQRQPTNFVVPELNVIQEESSTAEKLGSMSATAILYSYTNDSLRPVETASSNTSSSDTSTRVEEVLFPMLSWEIYDSKQSPSVDGVSGKVPNTEARERALSCLTYARNDGSDNPQENVRKRIRFNLHSQQPWTVPSKDTIKPRLSEEGNKTNTTDRRCGLGSGCCPCFALCRASVSAKATEVENTDTLETAQQAVTTSAIPWLPNQPHETEEIRRGSLFVSSPARRNSNTLGTSLLTVSSTFGESRQGSPSLSMPSALPRLHDVNRVPVAADDPRMENTAREAHPEDFFDFIRLLGTGSYGKVHLARLRQTQELLAIKVQLAVQRKRGEVELKTLLLHCDCPFLVTLHSHFSTHFAVYLVMEYVPGGTLTAKLKERFSVVATSFYTAQIALALIHLHSHGVLYRDLKPDNLLFTKWSYLKLCDFGSCHFGCKGQKKIQVATGTPRYWSPEKFRQERYGRPADWWSLGVIFYQMLMAKLPFTAAEPGFEAYGQVVMNAAVTFSPNLADDAVSACRKFLEKDPDERLGGPQEANCVYGHSFYRRLVDWDALLEMRVRPPPMYAHRYASMP